MKLLKEILFDIAMIAGALAFITALLWWGLY
jgi:hypothetical protein